MGFEDIIETSNKIAELDENRSQVFEDEFAAFENAELTEFRKTRGVIKREQALLDELQEELIVESENLDLLVDEASFLSVDQAVRHRDATVEKLESHVDTLETFCESITRALDVIESNLDELEEGNTEDLENAEPHLANARTAIKNHNEAVSGLDKNFMIMSAYLD